MIRTFLAAATAAGALAALALPAVASAQTTAPPVVQVRSGATAPTITGADALAAGPTTFRFVSQLRQERDYSILQLKAGVTQEQATSLLATLRGEPSAKQIAQLGSLVAGGTAHKGHPQSVTTTLAAGQTLVVDTTRRPAIVASFAVSATANGATAPTPSTTVVLDDFRFGVPGGSLPSHGTIRFVNRGDSLHFATLVRTASRSDARTLARELLHGHEKAAMKLATGEIDLAPVISPGVTADVVVPRLRKGSYVLVCFWADAQSHGKPHVMLGMDRVVTVR